jgi:outer membrane lipoprotein SlyB
MTSAKSRFRLWVVSLPREHGAARRSNPHIAVDFMEKDMFMKRLMPWLAATAIGLILSWAGPSQAQGLGSGDYASSDARRASSVEEGVVIHARAVNIEVAASPSSRIVGGAVGAAACARMTNNVGNWAVRASLMTACAAGGERVANNVAEERREAIEVIVKLSSGRVISVTQEGNQEDLRAGDKVYIIRGAVDRILKA